MWLKIFNGDKSLHHKNLCLAKSVIRIHQYFLPDTRHKNHIFSVTDVRDLRKKNLTINVTKSKRKKNT